MPSQMDHIADVATTGGTELHRLRQIYEFPEFVKTAQNIKLHLTVPPETSQSSCADAANNQFWCHTKVSCWLSHLFYQEKRAEFSPRDQVRIEAKLVKYAEYFDIVPECLAIQKTWQARHKTAEEQLPDSAYAYVWYGNNGTKERSYPLRNGVEVKTAADYLATYRDRFPYETRRVMATKILEKAAQYSAAISEHAEFLEKQAGRGCGDKNRIEQAILKRAYAVPVTRGVTYDEQGVATGGVREIFMKMAEEVKKLPRQAIGPDTLVKLASTLDQCDRLYGLTAKYDTDGIERPEDVCFETTFSKTAADAAQHVPTTTGKVYEKSAFKRLNLGDVECLFGSDFAAMVRNPLGGVDVEKMAEQVATLPRPDAQLLDSMLSDNGIVPIMHKTAEAQAIAAAEMERIAATYFQKN